jgi:hypothetical protein
VDALELQSDEVAVKTDPAPKVGHLQMNMADVCDDLVGRLGLHCEKAKARIVAWASVRECHPKVRLGNCHPTNCAYDAPAALRWLKLVGQSGRP